MFKYLIFFVAIGLSVAAIPRRPFYGLTSGGRGSVSGGRVGGSISSGGSSHASVGHVSGSSGSSSSHASGDEAHAEIKAMHSDVRPDGFEYALETSNGIQSAQSGDANGNIQGDFQWVSPEGEHVQFSYIADENGYQPKSDLLPTPPPIPEYIIRALEYIRTHPPKEESERRVSAPSSSASTPKKPTPRRKY
ncbi:larval cuticle protein 2 [Zeugodacus cucurbitae]|uniref:larval cuticle protein 2 n=1 Tax=Zeugodacus cucurbitae TaxID=28588 RepID=UPI0023D9426B|nr:larval cuticle protein 2 [Zeugodacus cucurbitae]